MRSERRPRRAGLRLGSGLGLGLGLWLAATPTLAEPRPSPGHAEHAHPPDAPSCVGGCATAPAPDLELSEPEIAGLLEDLALEPEPLGSESLAFEALLFHGPAVRRYLAAHGSAGLPAGHRARLERELARRNAVLDLRVIDDRGEERVRFDGLTVPLGEKRHVRAPITRNLQPLEYSGTVVRVGEKHLWARL
jgi:hypothetical protein